MKRDNYHLRELPAYRFYEEPIPQAFRKRLTAILTEIKMTGYKLSRKKTLAASMLHNLVLASKVGGVVFDTRRASESEALLRAKVWDAVVEAGLASCCLGSEGAGMVTRYRAKGKLLQSFKGLELQLLDTDLERNTRRMLDPTWHALVVLHDKEKKIIPFPPKHLDATLGGVSVEEYLAIVENSIERINRSNIAHAWEAFRIIDPATLKMGAFQPCVCLKQKHSRKLFQYARLYTWSALSAQNLSKQERRLVRIDREPVTELDYSGHQFRILYHTCKINPSPGHDIYRVDKVLPKFASFKNTTDELRNEARDFVKIASIICLNTTSRLKAEKAVEKRLRNNPAIARVIEKTEGTDARGIVCRIEKAHPDVSHRFFSKVGAMLMTLDGVLMLRILEEFAKNDKPVLGIHDSILCKASDAEYAKLVMQIEYAELFGFLPVIKVVF